ncbi:uncharacterized protein LOC111702545 isoform X2 [Eurytemora carolleeae]|uniref:uncharacterized protein LOC111702545 isoform X2 n=1 Tax=Eurytemora carolleeae TaxID=1294199 RepID=UPI000C769B7A|nr:uncharacterized protein LOC111702545 isoform X2 [Eurytemora carolleeae]XP_023330042.1 uncharacterized protein LOC111702545 isoform X2 [Eurytemora carolleeae]|eukprot:XP_023330041.1 uncharacterized protein LOC111702545 isoform X2 [Eurytemora affinis]
MLKHVLGLFVATALECVYEIKCGFVPSALLVEGNNDLHEGFPREKREIQNSSSHSEHTEPPDVKPFNGYVEGPHPIVSDSLFSLIIFIYVAITFGYMFYAFCWRSEESKPEPPSDKVWYTYDTNGSNESLKK